MDYIVDIYTNRIKWWMKKYNPKEVNGPYGIYYRVKTDHKTSKKICRKAAFRKIKVRAYNKRWSRSTDYRKKFFDYYKPPYRCRYCNKKLNEEKLTVDHIIPVYQVKVNQKARNLLYLFGVSDVNDVRNLAPACFKCNKAKDKKMGLWIIKGYLGKYKWFWTVRKIVIILFLILAGYLIFSAINNNQLIQEFFKNLIF